MAAVPDDFKPTGDDTWADRRRADGTRTLWLHSRASDGAHTKRWDGGHKGRTWSLTSETAHPNTDEAWRADLDWLTLREDEVTKYQTPEMPLLLDILRPTGDGEDPDEIDWPFKVRKFMSEDDDFYQREGLLRRYARVNDHRVQFASCGDEYVAFLIDGQDVIGDQLAEFNWASESGMMSGAGGWTLSKSGVTHAVTKPSGDNSEDGLRGFPFVVGTRGTVNLLREWLEHVEYSCLGVFGAAALALEPLDPAGALTADQRQSWEAQLGSLTSGYGETIGLSISVEPAVVEELRSQLCKNEIYRSIKDALAEPIEGDWLRQALSEGDIGSLCGLYSDR